MQTTQTSRLGKGLDALIPSVIPKTQLSIEQLPINNIVPNPYQPRQIFNDESLNELANSIKQHGLTQPIVVREVGSGYELVVGERRLQACKLNKLETIPAIIKDLTDKESCELALVENIDRENLSVIEIAESLQRLIKEFNYTQETLSNLFSRSRSSIANILRLLKLPKQIKTYILDGILSEGHARTLIDFSNDETLCINLANEIIDRKLTVRQAERLTKSYRKKPRQSTKQLQLFDNYIETLSSNLNTNVEINHRKNKLTISLSYKRFKEYIHFLEKLCTIEISPNEL